MDIVTFMRSVAKDMVYGMPGFILEDSLASPAMGHWGTCPPQQFIFSVHFDSDYMSTVASCKNPGTFACAPPGTKSWRRH